MSLESSWQLGSFEPSSDEDKSKDPRARRIDPPRILNISRAHEGQIELRPPRPAPLLESLVTTEQVVQTEAEKERTPKADMPSAEQSSAANTEGEPSTEKRAMRRGLVGRALTNYTLRAFLSGRQEQRRQAAAFAPAEAPVRSLPAIETLPSIQNAPEVRIITDEHGNEIQLQPGQRLERRGWYSVVVDEHGREVQGAINYGEAFQREQKREQLGDNRASAAQDDQSDPGDAGQQPAGGAFTALPGVGTSAPRPLPQPAPMIASGQADSGHVLPAGQPAQVDPQHRLPKRHRNPAAVLASPWLWVAVAVLFIAYFAAALI